ncbi:hypothetical protein [Enterobacter quasimori]|uniref:hypothetical protein n=1 Tax=Enterobacter quasimori TaxID=2838947 RepID=UPI001C0B9692|nr:hypothetical protein [Enterobacter quasimori]MBT1729716.1 hypothetical protein [Enterobacter quasimori]
MNLFESFIIYLKDSKNIKPILISLLTILPLTSLCTYLIIDNIIIKAKTSRIDELTYDKNYLTNQLEIVQTRLEKQIDNEDSRIEKRSASIKAMYDGIISENNIKLKELSDERDKLNFQLAKCNSSEKLELYKINKENIIQLKQELISVQKNINNLYLTHSQLSSEYGYLAKECEKRGESFHSNICEHSSSSKAKLDSLAEEIKSQEQRRQFINNEILLLQGEKKQ